MFIVYVYVYGVNVYYLQPGVFKDIIAASRTNKERNSSLLGFAEMQQVIHNIYICDIHMSM